jgi:hypothetical protein
MQTLKELRKRFLKKKIMLKKIENFLMWLIYAKPFPPKEEPSKNLLNKQSQDFWKNYNFFAPYGNKGFIVGWIIGMIIQSFWRYNDPKFFIGQVIGYFTFMSLTAVFFYLQNKWFNK